MRLTIARSWILLLAMAGAVACSDSTTPLEVEEDPDPAAPDVGIIITNVDPTSVLPGGSFEVDYTLLNLSGYVGESEVVFFLQLGSSSATLDVFDVEFAGADLVLSRELTTFSSWFPGSYSLRGEVDVPGDIDTSNNLFAFEEPIILEAAGGDPHDVGVQISNVSPSQIVPGDTLTFEYTLLNLTGYSGPVTVNYQASTQTGGLLLHTEEVMLAGEARDLAGVVVTTTDLEPGTYRPNMRVEIENDTDPTNNTAVHATDIEVTAQE
jgi:hypothetical protein